MTKKYVYFVSYVYRTTIDFETQLFGNLVIEMDNYISSGDDIKKLDKYIEISSGYLWACVQNFILLHEESCE